MFFLRQIGRDIHREVIYLQLLKNKKLAVGVVLVEKVTIQSHGFNGYLGFCEGHVCLTKMAIYNEKRLPQQSEEVTLESFLKEQSAKSSNMTVSEVLEMWNKQQKRPTEVTLASDGTCASSITASPTVSSTDCMPFPPSKLTRSPKSPCMGHFCKEGRAKPCVGRGFFCG